MQILVGIDEAGRGCWAGPLVAAAVLLITPIKGLADSKIISDKRRRELLREIKQSTTYGIGWVWPRQIDNFGLTKATSLAMAEALSKISDDYSQIIIDGNYNYLSDNPLTSVIIKADMSVPAVSAASIVAKVARDDYMHEQAMLYPKYGFEKHVGYGTTAHISALREHGICKLHRLSYKPIKALLL